MRATGTQGYPSDVRRQVEAVQSAERERWRAAMTLLHFYGGDCPDPDQPQARAPNCQACCALVKLGA